MLVYEVSVCLICSSYISGLVPGSHSPGTEGAGAASATLMTARRVMILVNMMCGVDFRGESAWMSAVDWKKDALLWFGRLVLGYV
jgi:hypothetical protein